MLALLPVKRFVSVVSVASLLLVGCAGAPGPSARSGVPSASGSPGPDASDGSIASSSPLPGGTPNGARAVRYVALGDSYTIGTSVKPQERWPNQLARVLRPEVDLQITANLAAIRQTSRDLIDEQLPQLDELQPQFVSLLVGVNDVVRRVDADTYRTNLGIIFDAILERVPASRVLVLTTPDYTLTPHGSDYGDPQQQSEQIRLFNQILEEETTERGLALVDISPVSDRVPVDPSLLAADELHPSGKQYAGWVELMAPVVRGLLPKGP